MGATLVTPRLEVLAATLAILEADLAGPGALAALLGVRVPEGWPPGMHDEDAMRFFRDRLRALGEAGDGWLAWYAIVRPGADGPATLVGSCGYLGPPEDGAVEIGYSVVPAFRGRGFATEMVRALVARALATPGVARVRAEAHADNAASNAVLARCGFALAGPGREPGHRRWTFPPGA